MPAALIPMLGLPLIYLGAFALVLVFPASRWSLAKMAAGAAVMAAAANLALAATGVVDADWLGYLVAMLIAIIGWVIVRFSQAYLDGEQGQVRYLAAMLMTLSAASMVVLAQHLGLLVFAWAASSFGLHHLLTFYPQRLSAVIVAHKKFLVSRMAEICLLGSLALIYHEIGSLHFDAIRNYLVANSTLPPGLHVAAVLIALAAILKSAQLPLHGWLIQVMEAPTPVSALLHAGVVNLGGFVLIRLANLTAASPYAQGLLVVVGSLTAVLAGLVMMTRISIKVRLAWSTCAQMGFMLMECGLGLHDLALLHLLAHALYKAHAFLIAGETVLETRALAMLPAGDTLQGFRAISSGVASSLVAIGAVAGSAALWDVFLPSPGLPFVASVIAGLAFSSLLWDARTTGPAPAAHRIIRVLVLTQIYLAVHHGAATILPASAPPVLASLWVIACFAGLQLVQLWLRAWPEGVLSQRLYPWVYGGFYLDERFTRFTFRVWPARLPSAPGTASAGSAALSTGGLE